MKNEIVIHKSDCAMHNMPALPNGPCDCGASRSGGLPDAAIESAAHAVVMRMGLRWQQLGEDERDHAREIAIAACSNAFFSWPGAVTVEDVKGAPHLILPLPKEGGQ